MNVGFHNKVNHWSTDFLVTDEAKKEEIEYKVRLGQSKIMSALCKDLELSTLFELFVQNRNLRLQGLLFLWSCFRLYKFLRLQ